MDTKEQVRLMLHLMSENRIKTYRESTIEHYCGKILYKYANCSRPGNSNIILVKTEKYEKVWVILGK